MQNLLMNSLQPSPPRLDTLTRSELSHYFHHTWSLYEKLFSAIKNDESLYLKPDPLRNPLIFYLGHTAAFYINKLKMVGILEEGVNDRYDPLFAIGVDPALPEHLQEINKWPAVEAVRAYRKTIFDIVNKVIEEADLSETIHREHPLWALMMGLEHDRIHFETSSVLIRQMDANLLERPDDWEYAPTYGTPPTNKWLAFSGGTVKLGKSKESTIFGWDNEYGELSVKVEPFQVTQNLITNAEFLAFVKSGNYNDPQYWSEEGLQWKQRTDTQYPKFWVPQGKDFLYRAMFDEIPMPLDWPVEVNAHEAWAYCKWRNDDSRLLSEAEFILLTRQGQPQSYDPAFTREHNLNMFFGSPSPVGHFNEDDNLEVNDLYGNVWDWLKDDFYPLPGFKVHPLYTDFSEPFMDAEHSMMAGGSWATTGTGASKYYRLWFRRHFYQHAGFRLAQTL